MYTGSGFSDWEIGDIAVIKYKEQYHLFHLIIPNHDYIAHAVSDDGIIWHRAANALFVGHPGEWDDDMLWTMDVVDKSDAFYMYYTGLKRQDKGVVSRIGLAISKDLMQWEKVKAKPFPISPKGTIYETLKDNPRNWLSFRDPFYVKRDDREYLLVCTRANHGPLSRRGCAGLVELIQNEAVFHQPLLYPMVYDDVECPCYFQINGYHYIVGSIREDIKVRYWFSTQFEGPYNSFHADVLLPQGNYAARIVKDGDVLLMYNFSFLHGRVDTLRVLPPPKQIDTDDKGRIILRSYYRWQKMIIEKLPVNKSVDLQQILQNPTASFIANDKGWTMQSQSGYEIFGMTRPSQSFIWEGTIHVEGLGKLGLVSDLDNNGNGYFISFDVTHGQVQIRAWGFNPENDKSNFIFNNLQTNVFDINPDRKIDFKLIRFGHYIELCIDDIVKLTLIDYTYNGKLIGFYTASAVITITKLQLSTLPEPADEYGSQENAALSIEEDE